MENNESEIKFGKMNEKINKKLQKIKKCRFDNFGESC